MDETYSCHYLSARCACACVFSHRCLYYVGNRLICCLSHTRIFCICLVLSFVLSFVLFTIVLLSTIPFGCICNSFLAHYTHKVISMNSNPNNQLRSCVHVYMGVSCILITLQCTMPKFALPAKNTYT